MVSTRRVQVCPRIPYPMASVYLASYTHKLLKGRFYSLVYSFPSSRKDLVACLHNASNVHYSADPSLPKEAPGQLRLSATPRLLHEASTMVCKQECERMQDIPFEVGGLSDLCKYSTCMYRYLRFRPWYPLTHHCQWNYRRAEEAKAKDADACRKQDERERENAPVRKKPDSKWGSGQRR